MTCKRSHWARQRALTLRSLSSGGQRARPQHIRHKHHIRQARLGQNPGALKSCLLGPLGRRQGVPHKVRHPSSHNRGGTKVCPLHRVATHSPWPAPKAHGRSRRGHSQRRPALGLPQPNSHTLTPPRTAPSTGTLHAIRTLELPKAFGHKRHRGKAATAHSTTAVHPRRMETVCHHSLGRNVDCQHLEACAHWVACPTCRRAPGRRCCAP
mmetsp:Transcript_5278/g.9132  ORF Transcript_5278/g.9132 Transcript_5278/m.9132 type:complete len:210 (+) Transcript_5278:595-1224(+)